jgi:hypothetical protein
MIMPISHSYSRFTTTGQEEIEGDFPRPPAQQWHKMRIRDIIEATTQKGDLCFIQSSEFREFETPLVIRTYYMPSLEWSIARMDNLFRNLGHKTRSGDVRGAEFEGFLIEKDFEDKASGDIKKRLEIKKASLWLKEEDFQQKYTSSKTSKPSSTDIDQPSLFPEPLVEDEIPF